MLLAWIDDADAAAVMNACKVNLFALREKLIDYIENDLKNLEADDDGGEPKRSAAFQRVLLRAGHHAEGWGIPHVPARNYFSRY